MVYDQELDSFKQFDLRVYAASLGFVKDGRRSGKSYTVMRRDSEKIVVSIDADRHYVYFSFLDDFDRGTIIDFVQRRKGLNLGRVRRELRPWIHGSARPAIAYQPLISVPKDRQAVEHAFLRMDDGPSNAYLESRALPFPLLTSPRFVGRICTDKRGNAVFPHFDEQGLCGFETRGPNFTNFSAGGIKGLWASHGEPDDRTLVVAESPIDALSFAMLFADPAARYASTGGAFNDHQSCLLLTMMLSLPIGGNVAAATDNDPAGRSLAAKIEKIVTESGRSDLFFQLALPPDEGADWNDVLRAK